MLDFEDTICAPATSVGSGAISVIRVSGADALGIADRVIRFRKGDASSAAGYSLKYGEVPDTDEVVVSIFRAPHSYTGEDSVEISCHASAYVVESILEKIVEAGARMARPGEFTRRAFVNGKMDLAQAEAVADVIAASTEAAHRVAVNQLKGHYSEELRGIRGELLELTALMELELDFSEEDVEFADRRKLEGLLEKAVAHIGRLADSFRTGNAVKNGVPVAIVGAPNSGKSTLLNALLGEERAIVSDIPGTTRDSIEDTVVMDGILFRFIDTAGIRESSDTIEKLGIERSLAKIAAADIVVELLDATAECVAKGSESAREEFRDLIAGRMTPGSTLIRVSNKTDLSPALEGTVGISAKTGEGLDELRARIVGSVRDRIRESGTIVTNLRHYEALKLAQEALGRVSSGLTSALPSDLVAEDLRDAVNHLNEIFGDSDRIDFKAVTDVIFGRFCVGK